MGEAANWSMVFGVVLGLLALLVPVSEYAQRDVAPEFQNTSARRSMFGVGQTSARMPP